MVASKSCFEKRVTSNNGEVVVEASCAQLNVSASSGAACKSDYACDNDAAHIIINEDTDIYDEIGGDGPYLVATGVSVH
jgi:hypothetical protein